MKIPKILLTTAILSLFLPSSVFASFKDVPETHPKFDSIQYLSEKGVIKGYSGNKFKPDKLITKGEFLALIFKNIGFEPTKKIYKTGFKDIPNESWLSGYVKKALDLDLIKPAQVNPNFSPMEPITKLQAVSLVFKLHGIPTPFEVDIKKDELFNDVNPKSSFAYITKAAKQNGIIDPENPNLFKANKKITRGDATEIVYFSTSVEIIPEITFTFTPNFNLDNDLANHPKFPILLDIWERVNQDFYFKSKFNSDDLIYNAIDGLIENLNDEHTIFEKPMEAGELSILLEGDLEGVGIQINLIEDQIIIVRPLQNSPAYKAGLKTGDIITKINSEPIKNFTLEKIIKSIRGKSGSSVKLTILRGNQEINFDIVRASISLEEVTTKIIDEIAYIDIEQFYPTTYDKFTKAIEDLNKTNLKGLIIDLRGNPGGYLDIVVRILEHFISKDNVIVKTKTADSLTTEINSTGAGELSKYPLIVLVDGQSASASEIFAGAIQDYKLGKIIGEKTFGKGSVQDLINYTDDSILKITIAHWLTPISKDIDKIGIYPDIEVKMTQEDILNGVDPQLDRAMKELE